MKMILSSVYFLLCSAFMAAHVIECFRESAIEGLLVGVVAFPIGILHGMHVVIKWAT